MVRITREISIGSIVQILSLIGMIVIFAAGIRADLDAIKRAVNQLETRVERFEIRMDNHISGKP